MDGKAKSALRMERAPPSDVENALTRAVAKVLGTLPRPSERTRGCSVDRPPRHQLFVDQPKHMRLLAEQIVKKVGRKYEERLRELLEKDQAETERRLLGIREEYERERISTQAQMERERHKFEEALRDRERNVRYQMNLHTQERESKLDADRRSLENRLAEFLNVKEQFERMRGEQQSKTAAELERLEIEKERVVRKESAFVHAEERARRVASAFAEAERIEGLERVRTLEMRITDLSKKLADAGAQNYELRNRLDEKLGVESDLVACKEAVRRESAKCREFAEKLQGMTDYDALKQENRLLTKQVDELRRRYEASSGSVHEQEKREQEARFAEEAAALKIRELRLGLTMMSDHMKSLTSERNYLRDELNLLRKDRLKSREKCVCNSTIGSEPRKERQRNSSVEKGRRYRKLSAESSDGSSSLSSLGDVEQISKRIREFDKLSRDLDACVDQFSGLSSGKPVSPGELPHERHTGKPFICESGALSEVARAHTEFPDGPGYEMSVPVVPERFERHVPLTARDIAQTEAAPPPNESKEDANEERSTTEEFAERLRNRSRQQALQAVLYQRSGSDINESAVDSVRTVREISHPEIQTDSGFIPGPVVSSESTFEGVDPVMARYMALVLQQRSKKDEVAPTSTNRSEEGVLAPEVELDKPAVDDDEIQW